MATNYVEVVKWFRKAADQNFADGQNSLGFYYATGQGVAEDHVERYRWWMLAAAQGVPKGRKGLEGRKGTAWLHPDSGPFLFEPTQS